MAKATKPRKPRRKARHTRTLPALPGEVVGEINGFPIRRVQAGALTGADYNPRTISDSAMRGLKKSTAEFGLVQAIVWNKKTQRVVGGHQRLQTLDPDEHTDVVEVDLDLIREKALNLALNSGHIAGEFTAGLGDLLAELEVEIPDLAADLHLGELHVDVPTVDDLLDGDDPPGGDGGGSSGGSDDDDGKGSGGKSNWDASDLKQMILVLTETEHEEAVELLDVVMKSEDCESHTAAVMWLLRNYE